MAFNKLQQGRDLLRMRQKAKALQKELEQVVHVEEKDEMKVKVNGAQNVIYLEINGEDRKDIVELINKATKNVQKKAAKRMMESGEGLSGLFGG